jgi:hypothetical protein
MIPLNERRPSCPRKGLVSKCAHLRHEVVLSTVELHDALQFTSPPGISLGISRLVIPSNTLIKPLSKQYGGNAFDELGNPLLRRNITALFARHIGNMMHTLAPISVHELQVLMQADAGSQLLS